MPMGSGADLSASPLVNAKDIEYVIDLFMGNSYDKITVVPDTGSTWLAIEGHTCSTCLGTKYDYSNDAATFNVVSSTTVEKNYGSVKTKGFTATDKVCLKTGVTGSCVSGMNIFIITEQSGIASNIDGIWGMASNLKTTANSGTLLINSLKTASLITNKIFAFGLKTKAGSSFLDFGKINNAAMRSASELAYIPALTDYWWAANMNGIKFGAG